MTNWQTKKLGDITTLIKDGTHGSHSDVAVGIPLLSAKDIGGGKVNIVSDSRLISTEDFNAIHKSYKLQDGDVLLTIVGSLGRVGIVRDYADNYTFQRSVAILRFSDEIDGNFAYHTLADGQFQHELLKRESKGAQGGVYLGDISKIKIQIPEKPEQERIVAVLEVWDEYIEKLTQKIALKEQLKKGLMQQLLTGKRRLPGFVAPWRTLEFKDIFKVLSKYPGYKSSEYLTRGKYPIFDQSYDKHISGYISNEEKVIADEQPITLFGDHSRVVKYIDVESFAVGNDGIKLLKAKDAIDDYYAYLLLKSYRVPNTGYNRHFKYIADATFDIPEPDEQRQIASIIKIADIEIVNSHSKLEEFKLQKKYLLKNLITGTIRTPATLKPKGSNS